jgi:hypothetical protein
MAPKKNRSRLDFFLVSNDILNHVKKCKISDSLSISLFDHKSIYLDFTKDKVLSKLYINRTILSNPRTDDVVLAAFADTYLSHAIADQAVLGHLGQHVHGLDPVRALDDQKLVVGNFIKLLKEYNNLCERPVQDKNNRLIDLLIAEKNTEILAQKDRMWDVDRYNALNLSCEDDVFLEALVSNIKGQVVSFQSWVKKVENKEKNLIISRLNMLKVDFDINSCEICRLEEELKALLDKETLLKVKSMKLFSCLNNERPTPLFLSLARASSKGTNLSAVCKKDGSPYLTEEDKVEGIVSYYEDIYRKPITDRASYSGCIENFLGIDIISSPIVVNSKLTDTEKTTLDSPLTIDELDNSFNKCNIRSAPG